MPTSRSGVLTLWAAAVATMVVATQLHAELRQPVRPLDRAEARGWVEPGVPRLDPDDPMANAATLRQALDEPDECAARGRWFEVQLDGKRSRVRLPAEIVCQLLKLKRISAAQPGYGQRGLGELAAFLVGTRRGHEVTVTRLVVPPFRFTGDSVTFLPADLGPLEGREKLIGTYHTHPDGDEDDGTPSEVDLRFMQRGSIDFHGRVGRLATATDGVDWLFDIVEPREGGWNVYAHDRARLSRLAARCSSDMECPLDDLRLAGSDYYLLTRYYSE